MLDSLLIKGSHPVYPVSTKLQSLVEGGLLAVLVLLYRLDVQSHPLILVLKPSAVQFREITPKL